MSSSFFDKLKDSIGTDETAEAEESSEKTSKKSTKKSRKVKVKNEDKKTPKQEKGLLETDDNNIFENEGELAVDLYQTDEEIVVQAAVAGVKPEDLDVSIENDLVAIRGNRSEHVTEEKKNYFYQECFWGVFSREIILPEEVDASQAQASFKEGVLTIRLPKSNRQQKKKIKVKG